jgi:glycosyltransferase involved in cell wall biosynthesis
MTPSLNYGGEELSTLNIARELMSRGHEVVFMSSGGPLEAQLKRHNIRFVKANIKGRGVVGIIKGAAEIRQFLKKEKISVIHSQTPWPALMSKLACFSLRSNIPVIWHDRGIRRGNYRYAARLANLMFDFVISNSDDEKKLLLAYGLSPAKVRRIHNGLNLGDHLAGPAGVLDLKKELGLDKDVLLIGMVGRMVKEKGFRWFIKAAAKLEEKQRSAKCHYILVGNGPLRSDLEALVRQLGLTNKFTFLGFRDDVPELMRSIDILVIPSEFEPFGNVVLEGMFAGTVVIASKVGGMKEIISDGIDGIFVEPKDPDMIAQNIAKLIENKELRKSISSRGKQKVVSYFNIQRVVDEIEDVYRKLITEAKA